MMPVIALAPVFVPLRVRVVVPAATAVPVIPPLMLRMLVAEVAPAVKVAVEPLPPSRVIAELMVSVWLPFPESVWIRPPLFRCRIPVWSV